MLVIAAIAGAGTMVVELAAVRLLAPWFGTSLAVWTNVIAVILLALALGYLVGGRLASREAPLRSLAWMLIGAGALVAWIPLAAAAASRRLLPEQLALHQAAELVKWGSLAVSLLVFLPPATLLGTVCPLVVESLARLRRMPAGSAGGAALFVSTLGSLLGVFSTSHLLLPLLGLQRTFQLASAILLVAGVLALWSAGRRGARAHRSAAVALLLAAPASGFVSLRLPSLPEGKVELARRESSYQALRVVEDRSSAEPLRLLQVNEGFDSFQSVWQARTGTLPDGFYYNDFLLPSDWSPIDQDRRVLVLGLGAGTVVRVFEGSEHPPRFVGVELDPAVVELGRQYFGLRADDDRLAVLSGLDARLALHVEPGPFDQIVLDCYANQVEIPAHLCTVEFFGELRACLTKGGWLTANLGGFGFEDPVVASVARTCVAAFGSPALLVRVPHARNFLLLARRDGNLPWENGHLQEPGGSSRFPLGPRALPGFARVVDLNEDGPLLTDDRCPIEILQLRSITEAQALRDGAGS